MKKLFILFVLIFVLASCNAEKETNNNIQTTNVEKITEITDKKEEKLKIVTSIIPLASITNYVGGEYVEAISLVPVWVSPHGFDLKPNQMVNIEESDLIVSLWYDHIDGFLDKAIEWKNVLLVANGIEMVEWSNEHHHNHEDEHGDEDHHDDEHSEEHEEEWHEEHEDHEMDPHVWTSSENALIIARSIENKLSELQPQNSEIFSQNYTNFEKELLSVKQSFIDKVKWKKQSEFIVFHDAYSYLFAELGIDDSKKLVFRTNVLSDPNSAEMKEIIDEITIHWVKNIYKEPQFSASNLDKLSTEYKLEVNVLNPLWSDSSSSWYIENYKNNLKVLEKIYE